MGFIRKVVIVAIMTALAVVTGKVQDVLIVVTGGANESQPRC